MTFRVIGAVLAFTASAAIVMAWTEIGVLGGTLFWDYRYVILIVGTLLGLSLLDTALVRIARWLEGAGKD